MGRLRWMLAAILALPLAGQAEFPITNITEVLHLPRSEAGKELPVKVQGVVTRMRSRFGFFLSDEQGAIYARFQNQSNAFPEVASGVRVEVEGVTQSGAYAPMILARRVNVIGPGTLPVAARETLNLLTSGHLDCRLIRVEGVVQAVWRDPASRAVRLQLSMEGSLGVVEFPKDVPVDFAHLESLIDAQVETEGVLAVLNNLRGEMIGFRILALGPENITTLKAPPDDPFAAPATPLKSLNTFTPLVNSLHRVVTTGTVTYQKPGRYLIVQDGGIATRVGTRTGELFAPGDQVRLAGFRELTRPVTGLGEALIRRIGTGPPPLPVMTNVVGIYTHHNTPPPVGQSRTDGDYRLTTLTGTLKETRFVGDTARYLLDQDGTLFEASLPVAEARLPAARRWTRDSVMEVTGVCEIDYSGLMPAVDWASAVRVTLLGRSAMDFRIVQAAPWWTRDRLMLAVGTVLVGMLLVLVWNLTLRRRVATKSAALSHALRGQHNAELEFEAERRERRRLAADLHDLIAQGIAAAASQLDAARAYETREPGKAAAHRAVAREQLTQCSADVRRTLWGLRADVLDGRTFPQALKALATRLTQGTDVVCRVECSPDLTETLPDFIAGNLLILVQEAVSNAIRHAGTSEILVTCSLDSAGVVMHIEDSGKGFQPEASPGVQDGHFGLRSMRERIDLLHGSITIASQPGSGTRLTVHLPRSSFGFADAFTAL